MVLQTDYLVVGGGASGLAFADTLVAEAENVEVTVIDPRQAAGGHWLNAYPFVRLHTPSAYYGVNSLALGEDRIDRVGENAGYYERATGEEVAGTSPRPPLSSRGRGGFGCSPATSISVAGARRAGPGPGHGCGSRGLGAPQGSSTLDTWKGRSPPPTPPRSTWRRALGSCPSTTCRRPRRRRPPM